MLTAAPLLLPSVKDALSERIMTEAEVQRMLQLEPNARNNALLRLIYAAGLALTTTVGYDAYGNVTSVTDPRGAATTFTVDMADLLSGGSVVGSSASDTLLVMDSAIDLRSTSLSSVEIIKAGTTDATTFTVNSDTQISATVPTGATSGKITVTNSAGTGTSATSFACS